jgi:hypothetical protein
MPRLADCVNQHFSGYGAVTASTDHSEEIKRRIGVLVCILYHGVSFPTAVVPLVGHLRICAIWYPPSNNHIHLPIPTLGGCRHHRYSGAHYVKVQWCPL